jgi:hypothetical protein
MAPDEAGTEEHSVRQMLPSLFASGDGARAWKVARAAAFALLGAGAAVLRNFIARRFIWPKLR